VKAEERQQIEGELDQAEQAAEELTDQRDLLLKTFLNS